MSDDRVFYGPHECVRCGKAIAKASTQQGGEEFDYPDGPIYPNTAWDRHNCDNSKVGQPVAATAAVAPE